MALLWNFGRADATRLRYPGALADNFQNDLGNTVFGKRHLSLNPVRTVVQRGRSSIAIPKKALALVLKFRFLISIDESGLAHGQN